MRTGSVPSQVAQVSEIAVSWSRKPGHGLGDLDHEPEVGDGVEERHPLPAGLDLAGQLVAEVLVVGPGALVVGGDGGELVQPGAAGREEVAVDARPVAVLLDQLDLHRAGLGHRHLHVDHRLRAAVGAGDLDAGQHVEGPDAEHRRPIGGRRRTGRRRRSRAGTAGTRPRATTAGRAGSGRSSSREPLGQGRPHRAGRTSTSCITVATQVPVGVVQHAPDQAPVTGDRRGLLGVEHATRRSGRAGGTRWRGRG